MKRSKIGIDNLAVNFSVPSGDLGDQLGRYGDTGDPQGPINFGNMVIYASVPRFKTSFGLFLFSLSERKRHESKP